ncbi:NUDIX hydrolase [Timonella senegalensis]|uniref:NUDIX hydrolase n=1 Tax=Timonella senegalensis TaxID=1465825 RepID=UPI002FE25A2B
MAIPDFVVSLRSKIGTDPLWLSGVTAVITRGTEILLVQRADNLKGTPVTGIIDPGEHPAVAGAREALEEANVVVTPTKLALVAVTSPVTYENGDVTQYLDLTFHFDWVSGDPYPTDGENVQARWFELDDLPQMSQEMRGRISAALSDDPAAAFSF